VATTASAARINGGQRFRGFNGGNARERTNFGRRPVAFSRRPDYSSKDNSTIYIIGRQFEKLTSFFNKPCDSQLLEIYEASNKSHLKSWAFDDIKEKVIHIPLNDIK